MLFDLHIFYPLRSLPLCYLDANVNIKLVSSQLSECKYKLNYIRVKIHNVDYSLLDIGAGFNHSGRNE